MKKIIIHLLFLACFGKGFSRSPRESVIYLMGGLALPSNTFQHVYANHMGGLGISGNFGGLINPWHWAGISNTARYWQGLTWAETTWAEASMNMIIRPT
jgi:hypothetical protein